MSQRLNVWKITKFLQNCISQHSLSKIIIRTNRIGEYIDKDPPSKAFLGATDSYHVPKKSSKSALTLEVAHHSANHTCISPAATEEKVSFDNEDGLDEGT